MWLTHFLKILFHWPDGIVVGNLIASVLWVPFTMVHLHRRAKKNLAIQTQELKEHVEAQFSAQTTEIKDHVTETNNAG